MGVPEGVLEGLELGLVVGIADGADVDVGCGLGHALQSVPSP